MFSEICQVRLDFLTLNLAQPTAATGDCTTGDRDSITLDAGGNDPNRVLCGDLTGQHGKLLIQLKCDVLEINCLYEINRISIIFNYLYLLIKIINEYFSSITFNF